MKLRRIASIFLITLLITACSTDFPQKDIDTKHLSGFIVGGNAGGIYGDAGLKITTDSIQMTDWPVSRLTDNLNSLLDTTLTNQTSFTDVYTIQIANKGELEQREFVDSLVVILSENGLLK